MKTLKITHYLNKNLKPIEFGDEILYPIYIRVLYGREVMRIKSVIANQENYNWKNYVSEKQFDSIENKSLFEIESKIITHIFNNYDKYLTNNDLTLSDVIMQFTIRILDSLDHTIYIKFPNISDKFKSDEWENNFSFAIKKHFLLDIKNVNNDFFEKSLNIDFDNFDLIKNFDFIKDDDTLKITCETIKELRIFEKKFYAKSKPLNVYEWVLNGGCDEFIKCVSKSLKENQIFKNLIRELNYYLIND